MKFALRNERPVANCRDPNMWTYARAFHRANKGVKVLPPNMGTRHELTRKLLISEYPSAEFLAVPDGGFPDTRQRSVS